MGPHDDQIGVHFNGYVVDVIKQIANPYSGLHISLKSGQLFFGECLKTLSGFSKFTFFSDDVNEVKLTLQCLAYCNGVFDCVGGYRSEVHRNEDAVL